MFTVIFGLIRFFPVLDIHKRSVNCQHVIAYHVHKAVTLCLPFIMSMGLRVETDISEVRSHSLHAMPFINFK
jgi:hypothetical protein